MRPPWCRPVSSAASSSTGPPRPSSGCCRRFIITEAEVARSARPPRHAALAAVGAQSMRQARITLRTAEVREARKLHALIQAEPGRGTPAAADAQRARPSTRPASWWRSKGRSIVGCARAGGAQPDGGGSAIARGGRVGTRRPRRHDDRGRAAPPGAARGLRAPAAPSPTRLATSPTWGSPSCRTPGCWRRSSPTASSVRSSAPAASAGWSFRSTTALRFRARLWCAGVRRRAADIDGRPHVSDDEPVASTAPRGFRAAGVSVGIKANGNLDLALIVADGPATAAAVFTTNRAQAAPVIVSREHLRQSGGQARAIIVNSGCANACTGEEGMQVAAAKWPPKRRRRSTARVEQVLVASTGVIGVASAASTRFAAACRAAVGLWASPTIAAAPTRRARS